jgi:hypothetical protein
MDFLDPKKQKKQHTTLIVGYALVTVAIGFVLYYLLNQIIGNNLTFSGKVVPNGFVFVSSQPTGANVVASGSTITGTTNTRLRLNSGTYQLKITDNGYRDWTHQVDVLGGDVHRFDYPFLFPTKLQTKPQANYAAAPVFTSQSPDHRWLLVKTAEDNGVLTEYDLKDPTNVVTSTLQLPDSVYATAGDTDAWQPVEWSTDNKHVLLLHTYSDGTATAHEYISLDRSDPTNSVNVTKQLNLDSNVELSLFNKKYDQYYSFDKTTGVLATTSLTGSIDVQRLEHIVAFKSYGDNTLLYATSVTPTGKTTNGTVSVVLEQGQKTYTLRTIAAGAATYDLDLTQYNGDWYVVVGSSSDTGVYLYKNPQQETSSTGTYPAAWRFFRQASVSRVNFSSTAQYLLMESGQQFTVYDAEAVRAYHYTATQPIDSPQAYALWMDGAHLTYVSGGKQVVFDYDYQNSQTLEAANAAYVPVFDPNYAMLYSVRAAGTDGRVSLDGTSLLVKK